MDIVLLNLIHVKLKFFLFLFSNKKNVSIIKNRLIINLLKIKKKTCDKFDILRLFKKLKNDQKGLKHQELYIKNSKSKIEL